MTLQPCPCDGVSADWPYTNLDSAEFNGVNCGDDGTGEDARWAEPTGEVGGVAAIKTTAAGIAAGEWTNLGNMTVVGGLSVATIGNVFTAPREGMWSYTFQTQPEESGVEDMVVYLRALSDYAAWGKPSHEIATPVEGGGDEGGGALLSGELPCLEGGTITFELYHTHTASETFVNSYLCIMWLGPIPS